MTSPKTRKVVVPPSERDYGIVKEESAVQKRFRQDVMKIAKTPSGIMFFRYLMDEVCGFHKSSIVTDYSRNEINPMAVVYNEAMRSVWLEVRKLIPPDRLAMIENPRLKF